MGIVKVSKYAKYTAFSSSLSLTQCPKGKAAAQRCPKGKPSGIGGTTKSAVSGEMTAAHGWGASVFPQHSTKWTLYNCVSRPDAGETHCRKAIVWWRIFLNTTSYVIDALVAFLCKTNVWPIGVDYDLISKLGRILLCFDGSCYLDNSDVQLMISGSNLDGEKVDKTCICLMIRPVW